MAWDGDTRRYLEKEFDIATTEEEIAEDVTKLQFAKYRIVDEVPVGETMVSFTSQRYYYKRKLTGV